MRVLSRAIRRLCPTDADLGFYFLNVHPSVSRRIWEIAQGLRRREERAKRAIKRPCRRLLRITGRLTRQAHRAFETAAAKANERLESIALWRRLKRCSSASGR